MAKKDKEEVKKDGEIKAAAKPVVKSGRSPLFPQQFIGLLADEIAKTVAVRLPHLLPRSQKKKKQNSKLKKNIENAIFLDTSAIIDGRIFDLIQLDFLRDVFVIPECILLELKHIADSQDAVKRERGRKGLDSLEKLKKNRKIKFVMLPRISGEKNSDLKKTRVDEDLIRITKSNRGRLITCDYNLEKEASIQGVSAVNINALAYCLKVTAVPGEALHIKILHQGKEISQGVGYLDDGTMIVVENGENDLDKTVDVVVSRVIQTAAGRILFAKKI